MPRRSQPTDVVLSERRGPALIVTINRPDRLNVINTEVATALGAAFEDADADPAVRALVLTGAGDRAFTAGADLGALAAGELLRSAAPEGDAWGFAGIVRHHISTPVILAANGACLGGGTEILLACDLAVAADHAVFGLPEATVGVYPGGGGAFRLYRHLPPKIALEALLTGRTLSADEAARWGLVNRVVPAAQVLESALELAGRIAANAPLSVAATKRIARGFERTAGALACPDEDGAWGRTYAEGPVVLDSEDCAEGVSAFREKRAPVWTGR
ncbi:enoyl-CoA hydratase-related protein [Arthrobacter halodurans]|uniref:Enoyl-CoA hydratase-related protein n=1 Tax=Arthrobacter halodurans TaxID=516699 RepID=A0ABV4UL51_9MICC